MKGDDGETKKMPNRKAETIISKLKANYRPSKAMAISEAGRLAKTGTFRNTHVELLIELGVDKKQVETLFKRTTTDLEEEMGLLELEMASLQSI